MKWLDYWGFRNDDLKKLKTGVALIVHNSNEEIVNKEISRLHMKFPVVFDKSSAIKQNNPLILNQYSVFTVNKEKEVIWLGAPINNEETWNLFYKTLQRHSISK